MSTLALLGGDPSLQTPYPPFNALGEEEKQAVSRVMDKKILSDFIGRAGAKFGGGEYVLAFEKDMCTRFSVRHAVSFNSATTALQAAVAAAQVGPGDEVITSPFTMAATASAILLNNAVPVFADIEEDTYCLDPISVEKHITPHTKAILVVNIFGGSARYDALIALARKHHLVVIEDNAQATGGMYRDKFLGTVADMGVFSFNVHKHLQSGEGGVLVTNNDAYAHRSQLVRNHGEVVINDFVDAGQEFYPLVGSNYRLTELHAAVAMEQLKKMDMLNTERVSLAMYLTEQLQQIDWLKGAEVLENTRHVFYVYPLRFFSEKIGISRHTFANAMKAEGFPLNEGYVKPLYLLPVYQKKKMYIHTQFPFISTEFPHDVSYEKGICPVTERLHEKEFMFTNICHYPRTKKDIDLFIAAILKVDHERDALQRYEKNES